MQTPPLVMPTALLILYSLVGISNSLLIPSPEVFIMVPYAAIQNNTHDTARKNNPSRGVHKIGKNGKIVAGVFIGVCLLLCIGICIAHRLEFYSHFCCFGGAAKREEQRRVNRQKRRTRKHAQRLAELGKNRRLDVAVHRWRTERDIGPRPGRDGVVDGAGRDRWGLSAGFSMEEAASRDRERQRRSGFEVELDGSETLPSEPLPSNTGPRADTPLPQYPAANELNMPPSEMTRP